MTSATVRRVDLDQRPGRGAVRIARNFTVRKNTVAAMQAIWGNCRCGGASTRRPRQFLE
jgi:hypothetical protein